MDISQCVNCGTKVIPTTERLCPSCGRSTDDRVVGVAPSAGSNDQVNPYQPLSLAPPSAGELDLLIAKREGGIRTSLWFMLVAGVTSVAMILSTGFLWFTNLLVIAFLSGLVGFIIDSRALAKLRRQRAESAEPKL